MEIPFFMFVFVRTIEKCSRVALRENCQAVGFASNFSQLSYCEIPVSEKTRFHLDMEIHAGYLLLLPAYRYSGNSDRHEKLF